MNIQAVINSRPPEAAATGHSRPAAFLPAVACAAGLVGAIAAAVYVTQSHPYSSGRGIGYALGACGGSLMLGLLLYPLRKRIRAMQNWGKLKYWFQFHMLGGIVGPLLIMFHSAFRIGSPNAAVAMSCMLLVVASGLVGRFLYRKIHHGLYGSKLTLQELQQSLDRSLDALEPQLQWSPQVRAGVQGFIAHASATPEEWLTNARRFALIGGKRRSTMRCIRAALAGGATGTGANSGKSLHENLLQAIDNTLSAAQQAAQLSAYERLFSLWHVVHIPFLCMLAITAVIHVVAVHVY